MITLITILGTAWIAVLGAVVALCRGARRGDDVLAAGAEELRRHELASGVVRLEHTDASGIGFMNARESRSAEPDGELRPGPPSAERRDRSTRSLLGAR
ncbi:MAG TPA: hypothetical protein VFW29_00120 [Solirubrobacteraceae bacterium]|nr:hypothetical protein [Solirubrobacteraceae bacterium]